MQEPSSLKIALVIALACFGFRVLVIVWGGADAIGDGTLYHTIAANIAANGCVSADPVAGGGCTPTWGGNQPPGYPAVVALAYLLAGDADPFAAALLQSLLFSFAAAYLCLALCRYGLSRGAVWAVGAVLALSPSLAGWSRLVFTETLSAAAAVWLLAELVRSLDAGRLRVVAIGLACIAGFFVRFDFVLFAVPIAAVAVSLHGVRRAVARLVAVALMVALPLGGWMARSAAAGAGALPVFSQYADGTPLARGFLRWADTWLWNQYQLLDAVWPYAVKQYSGIRVPDLEGSNEERRETRAAVKQLRALPAKASVPETLDRRFDALAERRSAERPFERWVLLPLRRAWSMWTNPFAAMGWPRWQGDLTRDEAMTIVRTRPLLEGAVAVVINDPMSVIVSAGVTAWRWLSLAALVVLTAALRWRALDPVRPLIALAALMVVVRTAAFSLTLLTETRYLVSAIAWLDVAVAAAGMLALQRVVDHLRTRKASRVVS